MAENDNKALQGPGEQLEHGDAEQHAADDIREPMDSAIQSSQHSNEYDQIA